MHKQQQRYLHGFLALSALLLMNLAASKVVDPDPESISLPSWDILGARITRLRKSAPEQSPLLQKQAVRLQARLRKQYRRTYDIAELTRVLRDRRSLLRRQIDVRFQGTDLKEFGPWIVSLQKYPLWLKANIDRNSFSFDIDTAGIEQFIKENQLAEFPLHPITSTLFFTQPDKNVTRAIVDHVAEAGYSIDAHESAALIGQALSSSSSQITLVALVAPGSIINTTENDLGLMKLLATGRSNYAGSDAGRISNVRKGLKERLNNVLVPPGATFSFNDVFTNISASAGWQEALGIFNGSELRPVPGGGICQVATTLYRGILLAGLPVTERANHSLFVVYYEKYGVGIDATVFPGSQDLAFVNDTGNYLLIQSYFRGFEAYVNVYGTPDGRQAELEGPFFSSNASDEFVDVFGRSLKGNEIGWLQTIHFADGRKEKNAVRSRYNSIPWNVVKKFTEKGPSKMMLAEL